uniref:MYND-type domain-containing protein n=1 Tax=Mycena chlorophos TaxID=658473 RepID=A0ABQ0M2Y5_MYCCL|nr:predicted protein [Mycena chlorophos]
MVADMLALLTSEPLDPTTANAVKATIGLACTVFMNHGFEDGAPGLALALERGLLVALFRALPWMESIPTTPGDDETPEAQSAAREYCALIQTQLPQYTIYLSVLRQIHKSGTSSITGILQSIEGSTGIARVWWDSLRLMTRNAHLAAPSELDEEICAAEECSSPASSRCGTCIQTAYCSPQCQQVDWEANHQHVCTSPNAGSGKADAYALATLIHILEAAQYLAHRDLAFALRVARHDLKSLTTTVNPGWYSPAKAGLTLPLCISLDYTSTGTQIPTVRPKAPTGLHLVGGNSHAVVEHGA